MVGNQKYNESLFYSDGVDWIMNNYKVKDFRSLPNMYNHNFEMIGNIKDKIYKYTNLNLFIIPTLVTTNSNKTCTGTHNVKENITNVYNKDKKIVVVIYKIIFVILKAHYLIYQKNLDFKTLNPDGIEIDTRYNEGN